MDAELLTVKEIADRTNVPENTVRRYLTMLEERFGSMRSKSGRSNLYSIQVVPYVRDMKKMYDKGLTTPDVMDALNVPATTYHDEPVNTVAPEMSVVPFDPNAITTKFEELQKAITTASETQHKKLMEQMETIEKNQQELIELLKKKEEPKPFWKRLFG